jgi:uncharacterized membrane protein
VYFLSRFFRFLNGTQESTMSNRHAVVAAAVAGLFAISSSALAADTDAAKQDKCYGVAKAGKNDCAADGVHACAGMAKTDNHPAEWKYVAKGTCKALGGKSEPPAKQK